MKNSLETGRAVSYKLLLFLVCVSIVFLYWKPYLNEDNYNYAVEEIHAYDSSLYAENLCTQQAGYSPRLYANMMMSLLMKCTKGNWPDAALLLIRVNFILYAAAAAFFACRCSQRRKILTGCMVTAVCMRGSLVSLGFNLNGAADVFLGTAIPLAFISIGCVAGEKQHWDAAWIFLALSEFMHVHEGIWAGAVLGMIFAAVTITDHKISWKALRLLPVYIASVLLVVLPSLMHSGKTDDTLFHQVYLNRTSHHLLLSDWGSMKIIMSALMLSGALYILAREYAASKKRRGIKIQVTGCVLLLILWTFLLAAEYLFTSVIPSAAVITMYIPKVFKYITFLGTLVYLKYGIRYVSERKYIQGLSLILIPMNLSDYGERQPETVYVIFVILAVISAACEWFHLDSRIFRKSQKEPVFVLVCVTALSAALGIFGESAFRKETGLIMAAVLLADVTAEEIITEKAAVTAALCSSVLAVMISTQGMRSVTGTEYVKNAAGAAVYDLAVQFKNSTDRDAVFLSDPFSSYSNGFQLVSQRTCYVIYKNVPSSKSSVIEWNRRIKETENMRNIPPDELKSLMQNTAADYVLVLSEKFESMEASGSFQPVVKNDFAGVYCLRE